MEAHIISWFVESQGIIGACKEVEEGDLLHHLQLGIEVGVEVVRFSIEDVEV